MPKISVVIPAYNAMRFLPQAVESVLLQTFRDFEIVIVNDGSEDETEKWLSQIADPRINCITQENKGVSAARNAGIVSTQGEYIAFLDADDLWDKTKLEKQVVRLDNKPEVGLVHSFILEIDPKARIVSKILRTRGVGNIYTDILQENIVQCGSTAMIRRSCFDSVGVFDQDMKFAEDWDMWIRIASRYHFDLIEEPLTFYRMHDTNTSKSYQDKLLHIHKVIEKAFCAVADEYSYLKNHAYGRTYLYSAQRAFAARDYRESSRLLLQATKHFPRLRYSKNSIKLRLKLIKARWVKTRSL